MKTLKFVILFFLSTPVVFSQLDYADVKHEFVATCGHMDTADINKNVAFVDSTALLKLTGGHEDFLKDYADAYYRKYLESEKRADLLVAISCHSQRWEQYGNTQALFELVSNYAGFNCFMSKKYLSIFEDKMEKNEIVIYDDLYPSQIQIIRELLCPD